MLSVRRRPRRWNLPACPRVELLRTRIFSRSLDEVTLTITREIASVHAKPTGFTAVRWSQGSTPRKYVAHDTYSSIFPVHKLPQTELTKDSPSKWRLWPLRPAVSCTRDGADWPKVVAVGAQQPISDFFGFIQMRDTLSTNGEHLRVAKVKSFPTIPKSMRSFNGDQNGANLKSGQSCWFAPYLYRLPRQAVAALSSLCKSALSVDISRGRWKKNCTNSHKKRKGGGSRDASHCARSASAVTPSVADLRMRKLLTFWRQMRRSRRRPKDKRWLLSNCSWQAHFEIALALSARRHQALRHRAATMSPEVDEILALDAFLVGRPSAVFHRVLNIRLRLWTSETSCAKLSSSLKAMQLLLQ